MDWRPWGDGRVRDRAHLIGVVSPQGVGTGAFSAVEIGPLPERRPQI